MALVVKAPAPWPSGKFTLFLAGAIDQGTADDWQSEVAKGIDDYDIVVLSPRRDDWDSSWEAEITNPKFVEQVAWESRGLKESSYRVFVVLKDSKAPITMLEFGKHLNDPGCLMVAEGFYREGNMEFEAITHEMPITHTVEDLITHLRVMLDEKGLRSKGEKTAAVEAPAESITESPAFKSWFSGSKITNSDGSPKVVYHGTKADFDTFEERGGVVSTIFGSEPVDRSGIFFSDNSEFAAGFAMSGDRKGGNVMPCYLSIKNPADFINDEEPVNKVAENGFNRRYFYSREQWEFFDGEDGKALVAALKAVGYDGAIISESLEGEHSIDYMAFSPRQIKSAIGNNGEFDPESHSITASVAANGLVDWRNPVEGQTLSLRDLEKGDPASATKLREIISAYSPSYSSDEHPIRENKQVKIWWFPPDRFQQEHAKWKQDDIERVDAMAREMENGQRFAPAVFFRGEWFDGNHRVRAAKKLGSELVPAIDIRDFQHDGTESSTERDVQREAAKEKAHRERMSKVDAELDDFVREFGSEDKTAAVAEAPTSVTGTPAFKAWFAGSEVVDPQGKPLVMYHATQSDIGEFRSYTHFGTQQAANDRHSDLTTFYDDTIKNPARSHGANIVPVYLSIKNALRLPDLASIGDDGEPLSEPDEDEDEDGENEERSYPRGWEGEDSVAMTLYEQNVIDSDTFWEVQYDNDAAFKVLEGMGYDGIVYENVVEDPGHDSWIVFKPSQVKSAIGNGGKFDADSHSITASASTLTSESAKLPPEPGTAAIPAGAIRLYHYTKSLAAAESIDHTGIKGSYARGDDNSGSGPSAGIWASTEISRDALRGKPVIELWVMPDQISRRADHWSNGTDPVTWAASGNQHVILNSDVPRSQIVGVNLPWHYWARYFIKENVAQTQPDLLTDERIAKIEQHHSNDAIALRWYRHNYGQSATEKSEDEDPHLEQKQAAVSDLGHRYMALSGDTLLEEEEIGDYEFFLIRNDNFGNLHQIGMQRKGQDAFDPAQQMSRTPGNTGGGSRKELKDLLTRWLHQYGELVIASHNPEKTEAYIKLVKYLGFSVGTKVIQGTGISAPVLRKAAASDDAERDKALSYTDEHEFLKDHYTGSVPSSAYSGKDMFAWQTVAKYPKLLRRVSLKDGTQVELRQDGKANKYVRTDAQDEIVRDEEGLATYLTDDEVKAKGWPLSDTAIMAFNDAGECVAQASDEWGADLVAVRDDFQKKGLGTILLTEFRRQFKDVRQMGQMTSAGRELAKSYYRSLTGKERTPDYDPEQDPRYLALKAVWRFLANVDYDKATPEQAKQLGRFDNASHPDDPVDAPKLLTQVRDWVKQQDNLAFMTPSAEKALNKQAHTSASADLGNEKYEVRQTLQLGSEPKRYYYLISDRKSGDAVGFADTPEEVESELKRLSAAIPKSTVKPLTGTLTVYRGEGGTSEKDGKFWTTDKEFAVQFTQTGRHTELLKAQLPAAAVYSPAPLPYGGDPDQIDAAIAKARKAGLKAVRCSEGTGNEPSIYVFDRSALRGLRKTSNHTITASADYAVLTNGEI